MALLPENSDFTKSRFSRRKVPENIDFIVIGSGISGLATAALLAKQGKKVVVIEQHYVAGGAMHTFELNGIKHDTGIHYVGNIDRYKPLLDSISGSGVEWHKMGWETINNVYDRICIGDNTYDLPSGKDNLFGYLCEKFPEEKEGITKYFEMLKKADGLDLFFKLKVLPYKFIGNLIEYLSPDYHSYSTQSAYDIISEIIYDEELIALLCGQYGNCGPSPKKNNFFTHASIVNHYMEGGYYPKGGPDAIANSICKYICENDGHVFVGRGVKKIIVENNVSIGVEMTNGHKIYAENVISSVGVHNTYNKLLSSNNHIFNNIPPSVSHFFCFINLKDMPDDLSSFNTWVYPSSDYEKTIDEFEDNFMEGPLSYFVSFPFMKDPEWKGDKGNAVIIMPLNNKIFSYWDNYKSNKRTDCYDYFKKKIGERLINECFLKRYPQLKDRIEKYEFATPATTQHYLGSSVGESYGLTMNSERLLSPDLRPETGIKNLYLTGQDICTHGFAGALSSAVITANVVLGYNSIYNILMGNNITL